jgi:hypothetical protein
VSIVRAPTLVPLENSLIRLFNGLIFYLLLPLAMTLFAWKAAVFPAWGSALLCVAVGVIASHGGPSVLEVVDDFDGDTFRAVYTVRFAQVIYVLHAFQKKSKRGIATSKLNWT